jgi:hypothetical protein
MGFFSWKTMDTDKSISNNYSNRGSFKVEMLDDKGNVWTEDNYEGYGVFGGKDFYELLAEMNGFVSQKGLTYEVDGEAYTDEARSYGISLAFKDNGSGDHTFGVKYPNLVEEANGWRYDYYGPDSCESQGYFYDDEDGESDELNWGDWNMADDEDEKV